MNKHKNLISKYTLKFEDVKYEGGFPKKSEVENGMRTLYRREWSKGVFIGNGMTGAMIYKNLPKVTRWELGRNDLVAHNHLESVDWATPRVPVGNVLLISKGNVINEKMELNIYDALAKGSIETDKGLISWTSYNHATKDFFIIDIETEGEESEAILAMQIEHGISHRIIYSKNKPRLRALPPRPFHYQVDGIEVSVQNFIKEVDDDEFELEGECCVAYKEIKINENKRRFVFSLTNHQNDFEARYEAIDLVKEVMNSNEEDLVNDHKKWWHDFYAQSYLSLSDEKWERFYWLQIYKYGCAISQNGVVLDSQGPWLTVTPWPTTVWNLNVQLCYMPLYVSNRHNLAESLINTLIKGEKALMDNSIPSGALDAMSVGRATNTVNLNSPWPSSYELGNLTWALFYVWRHYQVTLDKSILAKVLYPYLKKNINLYLHLMYMGKDKKLHLPETCSPEYPSAISGNQNRTVDCTYALSLFKWGCQTLLKVIDILSVEDEKSKDWQFVLDNLVDIQTDENGYRIGRDIPFAVSHRHYSHLFVIYPLQTSDLNDLNNWELADRSVRHWLSLTEALEGYSFTGSSAMAAILGDGNRALEYLNGLDSYLLENTMYAESGPVIETPLSATDSIHQMLLQSANDIIKVFPSVPEAWQDAEFENFLSEGAILISGIRKGGKTQLVKLEAKAKTSKSLILDFIPSNIISSNYDAIKKVTEYRYELNLKSGDRIEFAK